MPVAHINETNLNYRIIMLISSADYKPYSGFEFVLDNIWF